jgi:hypothetical protein
VNLKSIVPGCYRNVLRSRRVFFGDCTCMLNTSALKLSKFSVQIYTTQIMECRFSASLIYKREAQRSGNGIFNDRSL